MTASVSSWCRGNPCSTTASASISPAQCALPAASNGVSAGNEGWGYECPQHRDLLITLGPDGRHRVKARAVRAPINPSVSKGSTEAEPGCSASALSSRPAADAICLRACFSAVDCSSTARSWGWNRSTTSRRAKVWFASGQIWRTPGPDGRSIFTARTLGVAQACNAAAALAFPSAKSLVIPTVSLPVRSAAQGERRVIGIAVVQHAGSAKPRAHARRRWFKRWRLSDIRRRLRLPVYTNERRTHDTDAQIPRVGSKRPWPAASAGFTKRGLGS
jgi:hypothetical protein